MSAIFLVNNAGDLVEMKETPYDSEAVLQTLLAKYPQLLTGDGSGEKGARWVLVKREMAIASVGGTSGTWSLDHLFVDKDGIPTLVEVKQSSNSEIRRSVVGQLLDYAANAVVYWPVDRLRATFEATSVSTGESPDELISKVAGPDVSPDAFWQMVATNLQAQRVRLVFVADEIPPELRRVIEFLNGQMNPAEVIGIEVKQFSSDDRSTRTLVPKVIGRTAEAEVRKGTSTPVVRRDDWSWDAYERELNTPRERIATAKAVTDAVARYIEHQGLDWRIVPRKGYMAIVRGGDYKVGVIDVMWRKTPRFAVKIPASPRSWG